METLLSAKQRLRITKPVDIEKSSKIKYLLQIFILKKSLTVTIRSIFVRQSQFKSFWDQ